jgi:protease-4
MKFPELKWEHVQRGLLWIVLPLLLGVFAASNIPQPVVGIIHLDDAIYSYTEAVYLELERLRAVKPVVTSVNGMAASGAYYLAVGTDYIYAKPTSEVGNVGVIGYLPPVPFIYEDIISTGPYKLWGSPRDAYLREIEMIKQVFYEAVSLGRGDALKVGPEIVLRGQLWTGAEAVEMGIIDAIGTENDAVAKAVELAHLRNYGTADLYDLSGLQTAYAGLFFQANSAGVSLPYPNKPGLYLLFIPPLPSAAQP